MVMRTTSALFPGCLLFPFDSSISQFFLAFFMMRPMLQVYPALDPSTPIYAGGFAMQLIKRRLQEYSLYDETRFHTFNMRERFQLGPFEFVTAPFVNQLSRILELMPDIDALIAAPEGVASQLKDTIRYVF